jgi:hypothetical protein
VSDLAHQCAFLLFQCFPAKKRKAVRKSFRQCVREDREGSFISLSCSDAQKQLMDAAQDLFSEPAGTGRNGYPLEEELVEQYAYFIEMAPPTLKTLFDASDMAKRIQARYPWPQDMPRRIQEDPDNVDEELSPSCIKGHRFNEETWQHMYTVVMQENDGSFSAPLEASVEHLAKLVEPRHLLYEINRYDFANGVDWTPIGVDENGWTMFEGAPKIYWTPLDYKNPHGFDVPGEEKKKRPAWCRVKWEHNVPKRDEAQESTCDAMDEGEEGAVEKDKEEEFEAGNDPSDDEEEDKVVGEEEVDDEGRKCKRRPQQVGQSGGTPDSGAHSSKTLRHADQGAKKGHSVVGNTFRELQKIVAKVDEAQLRKNIRARSKSQSRTKPAAVTNGKKCRTSKRPAKSAVPMAAAAAPQQIVVGMLVEAAFNVLSTDLATPLDSGVVAECLSYLKKKHLTHMWQLAQCKSDKLAAILAGATKGMQSYVELLV